MIQQIIIDYVLKYLNSEDINTLVENPKLVSDDFYSLLVDIEKTDSISTKIQYIYSYLNINLSHDKFTTSNVFPTINKYFRKYNKQPLDKTTLKNVKEYYKNPDNYDNLIPKNILSLIENLFNKIKPMEYDESYLNNIIKSGEFRGFDVVQNMNAHQYRKFITDILLRLSSDIDDSKLSLLYVIFLLTVSPLSGDTSFGFQAMFMFFDILKQKHNSEILLGLEKVYINSYFQYKSIIKINTIEKEVLKRSFNNNSNIEIGIKELEKLSNIFKINPKFWLSPIQNKSERMPPDEYLHLECDFVEGRNEQFFESEYLENNNNVLLIVAKNLYNLARISFYHDKTWIDNKIIEQVIDVVDRGIKTLFEQQFVFLDSRILSVISARNAIKLKYNSYNNKWDPKELSSYMTSELEIIIQNKNYCNNTATIGKLIEEISKIQEYKSQNNVYISNERMYLEQTNILSVVFSLDMLRIEGLKYEIYDYIKNNSHDYRVFINRNTMFYEIGCAYLSYVKYLGPIILQQANLEGVNKSAIRTVDDYWDYFKHSYIKVHNNESTESFEEIKNYGDVKYL